MKIVLRCVAIGILLLVCCSGRVWAQEAIATSDLDVYRSPSKTSAVIDKVAKDEKLTVVRAKPYNHYYHIKTEHDVIGWVLASGVTVSPPPVSTPTPPVQPPATGQCDDTLWGHVYHSFRLVVHQKCITVTGTIVDATGGKQPDGVRHEADGDTHGWLKLDPQFQNLVNAGNTSAEGGNLVFEIICKYPVTQPDAQASCQGFKNSVTIPAVGKHVSIVGVYVQDTFHAQWMEIHPVTSITVQ